MSSYHHYLPAHPLRSFTTAKLNTQPLIEPDHAARPPVILSLGSPSASNWAFASPVGRHNLKLGADCSVDMQGNVKMLYNAQDDRRTASKTHLKITPGERRLAAGGLYPHKHSHGSVQNTNKQLSKNKNTVQHLPFGLTT